MPADVHVDVVRHLLAVHLGAEHRVLEDQIVGHDLGAQDVAAMIDVAQEHVERAHALLQALLQQRPFLAGHDSRDHVEGDQTLGGFGIPIDREGDADAAKQELGLLAAIFERLGRRLLEPARQLLIGGAKVPAGNIHFIKRDCHRSRLSLSPCGKSA